jgi:putative MATE family efflux protein
VAVVGRSVGALDLRRTRTTIFAVVTFAIALGMGVGLLGFLARPLFAQLLAGGASETVCAMAKSYMAVLFLATPFQFAGSLGVTVLQASGDTRTPLFVSVLTSVTNVFLNWILIYGKLGAPELGVTGAAIASAAAFFLEAALVIWVLLARKGAARLIFERPNAEHRKALRSVLQVSGPAFIEMVLNRLGFLTFAGLIGQLGNTAMATHQALIGIESIAFIMAEGFAVAAGTIVALKLGARRPDEAAWCAWIATFMSVLCLSFVSVAFVTVPRTLVSLMTSEESIIELGASCLLVAAFAEPMLAVTDGISASLRGAGDTRNPMFVAIAGPIVVRLFSTWLFAFALNLGLVGIWIGSTLDWTVRAIWLSAIFMRGKWRRIEV